MNSRLYRGLVWHTRGEPAYRFQYRVWYLGLDLQEADEAISKVRLLSHNRHNVTSFWNRDYLVIEGDTPPPVTASQRMELITVPRILGHAFNPVSFLLWREGEAIVRVQAEVHNTWGERHVYDLRKDGDDALYESGATKAFYVSPFLPPEGSYGFELREDEDGRLRIKIDLHGSEGEPLFAGGIDVRPLPLTDANLARLLATYPLVNLKTVAMIHWQGFKLWLRGVEFRPNPGRGGTKRRRLWPRGH